MNKVIRAKGHWCSKENQHKFLEELIHHYKLKEVQELQTLKKKQIIQLAGGGFIDYYNGDLKKAFSTIYPNYDWKVKQKRPHCYWDKNLDNQHIFFEELYQRLNFRSLEDFKTLQNQTVNRNGGGSILNLYSSSIPPLLLTLYPNYPWKFEMKYSKKYWESVDNQRQYLELFYHKKNYQSLEEFYIVTFREIITTGGRGFLEVYGNELAVGLLFCFPHFPWNFTKLKAKVRRNIENNNENSKENEKEKEKEEREEGEVDKEEENLNLKNQTSKTNNSYWTISNQKNFLEFIYKLFNFKSLNDWNKIRNFKFRAIGGENLLFLYNNDLNELFSTHYPSHNFHFKILSRKRKWNSILKIQNYMDNLYNKFELKSLEDWKTVKKSSIVKHDGHSLLTHFSLDFKSLLKFTYPNYCWNEVDMIIKLDLLSPRLLKSSKFWELIENQRLFFDSLYDKLNFTSMEDWKLINTQTIVSHSGKKLLLIYHFNIQFALMKIYPFFPWDFNIQSKIKKSNRRFALKSHRSNVWLNFDYQKQFLDHLFDKLNYKSIKDWEKMNERILMENGGSYLLKIYSHNLYNLFNHFYPNEKFNFHQNQRDNLQLFLNDIQYIFQVKKKDDWTRISKILLQDLSKYFSHQFRHYNSIQSIFTLRKFDNTKEKKYRELNLIAILRDIYPNYEWKTLPMSTARSSQRWLFVAINSLLSYSSHYNSEEKYNNKVIIEDYHHPKLVRKSGSSIQFDVFIPTLSIGIEYQGEQHYDEIPAAFGLAEVYRDRDFEKFQICDQHSVTLLEIPYWWDRSLSSLSRTFSKLLL